MKGQPVLGSRQRRSARTAALVLASALTLAACGGSGSEDEATGSSATAAIVDGQEYTVGEVQETTRELAEVVAAQASAGGQAPQEITPDLVMPSIVQIPAILKYAEENDLAVPTDAEIQQQIGAAVPSPSATTVDFFRANSVISQLTQEQQIELGSIVQEQDVSLSPRYRAEGEVPNWVEAPEAMPFELP